MKRPRRTDKEIFLDALSDGELHSNSELISKLKWDDDKYHRLRTQYIQDGIIVRGKGRGGKVGLAPKGSVPLKVFISYAHKDEEMKKELESHLRPLVRRNLIEIWSDRAIKAGENWDREIEKEIRQADIILLFVSVDFINSDFCYEKEMELAMERHDAAEAVVIPVILRNCLWKNTLFSKLQGVPKDAKPIASWPDKDDAYVDAVVQIEIAAQQLRDQKKK